MTSSFSDFGALFNHYRLRAGFLSLGEFGSALAEEGFVYEDSIFSKWKSGERVPRRRPILLAIVCVFIRRNCLATVEEINQLLFAVGQSPLTAAELSEVFGGLKIGYGSTRFNSTEHSILTSLDFRTVANTVVNGLVHDLGYYDKGCKIVVLTLVDEEAQVLRRVALSRTEEAVKAVEACPVPFHEIAIPLSNRDNILLDTIRDVAVYSTTEWPNMFAPVLSAQQAILNQRSAGITSSMTYPLVVHGKALGAMIYSLTKRPEDVSYDESVYLKNFSDTVAVGIYNAMQVERLTKE